MGGLGAVLPSLSSSTPETPCRLREKASRELDAARLGRPTRRLVGNRRGLGLPMVWAILES